MEQLNSHKGIVLAAVRIGLLAMLLYLSYKIVQPFLVAIVWGVIIATALYPIHQKISLRFNGNKKVSAVIITLVSLVVLIVPCYLLAESLIDTTQSIGNELTDGTFEIPPPQESVAEWPLIGESLYASWSEAATNIEAYTQRHADQLKALGETSLKAAASTLQAIVMFIFSIIVAGVFLNFAEPSRDSLYKLFNRLSPVGGERLVNNAGATVQSVAKGILGTAFIQSTLCTIGVVAVGVPGAGLWAILILLLAIMQLPPILILGPIAAYVFTAEPAWVAWIFLIYSVACK